MQSYARLIGLSFCLLVLGSACAPEGELKRTLHPPHERYLDRQGVSPAVAKVELTQEVISPNKGLPSACKAEVTQNLCIQCTADSIISYRCYEFERAWNPQSDCHYTEDSIRCLTKDPPFALYFAWRSSDEKFLRENFLTWQDTVHQIWGGKLQGPDKEVSERILRGLDWLSLALSQRLTPTAGDGSALATILDLKDVHAQKKAQELVQGLQEERLEGRLTLRLVLDRFRTFYSQEHGVSTLWDDVSTISLEGLED